MMSTLHVNINDLFFMKNSFFQNKNFHGKNSIISHFCKSLLQSGLTKESWILVSASAFHILHSLWKTPLCAQERMRVKKTDNILVLLWKSFWPHRSSKRTWESIKKKTELGKWILFALVYNTRIWNEAVKYIQMFTVPSQFRWSHFLYLVANSTYNTKGYSLHEVCLDSRDSVSHKNNFLWFKLPVLHTW